MRSEDLAHGYASLVGVVLVLVGLLGFLGSPIVGDPSANPILVTGPKHDIVHLVTGGLALFIAFRLSGKSEANGVIAFGLLYILLLVVLLIDADLFGLLDHPVNVAAHVLHAAVGIVSIAVGYMAKGPATATRG